MFRYLWTHRSRPPFCSKAFFKNWAKRTITFPTLLQTATRRWNLVRQGASIGADSCIGTVNLQGPARRLKVGRASFIGRATLMLHDELDIGSYVCINDGVTILTASHDIRDPLWRHVLRPVRIHDFAWIATGAVILPGVEIGRGAVVGAAAVVSKNVPPYATATGNPAIIKQDKRVKELSYNPVKFLAFQDAWLGKHARDPDA